MCYSTAGVFYTMHAVYPMCIRYSHLYRTRMVCICHTYTVFTIHAWLYHMHIANSAILDALDPGMSPFTESMLTYTYIHGPMVLCFCIYTVATYIVAMLVMYSFNYLQTEMGQLLFTSCVLLLPACVYLKVIHYSYILPMK